MYEPKGKFILPLRYIPFDIGLELSSNNLDVINAYLETKYKRLMPSDLSYGIGSDLAFIYQIDSQVRLYIFKYGIGVFSYWDEPYVILDNEFAVDYCQLRRKSHNDILHFSDVKSNLFFSVMEEVRKVAQQGRNTCRKSAKTDWEYNGLSYVMTISILQTESDQIEWSEMSDIQKKNLLVLLRPSIVNMEDSLYSSQRLDSYPNVASIPLEINEHPKNYSYNKNYGIYISWAAVVPVQRTISIELIDMIETMETDLQAMWMLLYCERNELKTAKLRPSYVEKYYQLKRRFTHFQSIDDSSSPEYLKIIRSALIKTSGIKDIFKSYNDDINFMIQQKQTVDSQKMMKMEQLKTIFWGITIMLLLLILKNLI